MLSAYFYSVNPTPPSCVQEHLSSFLVVDWNKSIIHPILTASAACLCLLNSDHPNRFHLMRSVCYRMFKWNLSFQNWFLSTRRLSFLIWSEIMYYPTRYHPLLMVRSSTLHQAYDWYWIHLLDSRVPLNPNFSVSDLAIWN